MKRIFTFIISFVISLSAFSKGQWTDYLSYSSAHKVVDANDKIYCATSGGLFTYDKSDNSILKLTGINGLSDVGIQTIAYGESSQTMLIAYENSNIDLIKDNQIFNLSDIKRKQITGDKRIYNILFVDQTAYLSCGFGIVAVNLEKREIKDTYYIGANGSSVVVRDMTFDGQNLFAATEDGLFQADINSPNLLDFNNWNHIENIPNPEGTFSQLEFFNGKVICNYAGTGENGDKLFALNNGNWSPYLPEIDLVNDIQVKDNTIIFAGSNTVKLYDQNNTLIGTIQNYQLSDFNVNSIHAESATLDSDGNIWIADSQEGLIKKGQAYEIILPEGPGDNKIFSLTTFENDLWATTGGRNSAWNNLFNNPQFQQFNKSSGDWNVFNGKSHNQLSGFHDIVCVAVDPTDPDHIFAGSWGGGIVEFNDNQFVERYMTTNSSLQTALPGNSDPNFVRIGGLKFDAAGNLWATNSLVDEPLSVFKKEGGWESYDFEGVPTNYDIGDFVITENGDKWIILPRSHDLFVLAEDNSSFRRLSSRSLFNSTQGPILTRHSDIYSIALDKDGAIWVGASNGVSVYSSPEQIWNQSPFYSSQPGLDLNDGIYHPLLETETVTAIAVDGANYKWFGTKNSGVFLISEDGTKEMEHFTETNSPLLSNEISSIAINPKNGEVFFGTDKGLISYMGGAIDGKDDYSDVYAYPNPVREDYSGDIVITGLIEDTDVKITDISGNLVFETKSLGGQAIWNGRNLNGNRVSTGVYMVMGNDKLGEETFVTKILFIH